MVLTTSFVDCSPRTDSRISRDMSWTSAYGLANVALTHGRDLWVRGGGYGRVLPCLFSFTFSTSSSSFSTSSGKTSCLADSLASLAGADDG